MADTSSDVEPYITCYYSPTRPTTKQPHISTPSMYKCVKGTYDFTRIQKKNVT